MTPQQIEAMKLALEALEGFYEYGYDRQECFEHITAIKEALRENAMRQVQRFGQEIEQEPEFFTHSVERPYDWSEWVCPDPKGYMMKCCDCGLVHEAEFSVVRYKSETEREYCDRVDDPNLQAVFRMRRSEQWSPEDTAHRTGGLPMAQPEQEPVAYPDGDVVGPCICGSWPGGKCLKCPRITTSSQPEQEPVAVVSSCTGVGDKGVRVKWLGGFPQIGDRLYFHPPQRQPLTKEEMFEAIRPLYSSDKAARLTVNHSKDEYRAIEAAHGIKE